MLERVRSKGNTTTLQECKLVQTPWKSVWQFLKKTGNQSISRPSNTTLGHILKGYRRIPQGHLCNYVHSNIIHNSQNLEIAQCPSTKEWIKKMLYIYTVEYYSAAKTVFVFLGLGYLSQDVFFPSSVHLSAISRCCFLPLSSTPLCKCGQTWKDLEVSVVRVPDVKFPENQ